MIASVAEPETTVSTVALGMTASLEAPVTTD